MYGSRRTCCTCTVQVRHTLSCYCTVRVLFCRLECNGCETVLELILVLVLYKYCTSVQYSSTPNLYLYLAASCRMQDAASRQTPARYLCNNGGHSEFRVPPPDTPSCIDTLVDIPTLSVLFVRRYSMAETSYIMSASNTVIQEQEVGIERLLNSSYMGLIAFARLRRLMDD